MPDASLLPIDPADAVLIGTAAVILLILLMTVLRAARPKVRKLNARQYNAELFKRRLALDELGFEALHNIPLKTSKHRTAAIDHVVRLPDSILLIVSAPAAASGRVRANPSAGQWRYAAPDHKVATMLNPVIQLHPLISAIRARFPLVRVRVLAVFPNSADFGGPPPKSCCRSADLADAVRAYAREDGPPSHTVETAWEPLCHALQHTAGGRANKAGSPPGTRRARTVS